MSGQDLLRDSLREMFTTGVFREFVLRGSSKQFQYLAERNDLLGQCGPQPTIGDAFDWAFSRLQSAMPRDAYIFQSMFTQKVLAQPNALRGTTFLHEFRAGFCKADLVVLDTTSTAVEIKSERDSRARLASQIENYRKVFAKVIVIAGEMSAQKILQEVPDEVGLLILTRDGSHLIPIREAVETTDFIRPQAVLEAIRTSEAIAILGEMGIPAPLTPNTQQRAALVGSFTGLEPKSLHAAMVKTLKTTRSQAGHMDLVAQMPVSLQAMTLAVAIPRRKHSNLLKALSTPLERVVRMN